MRLLLMFFGLALVPISVYPEPGVSDKEIIIGSCSDLASEMGVRGRMQTQAAKAYFDYVNENGGIFGRKLKLLAYDDHYDPDATIQCFNRLIDEGIFAGGFFMGSANAAKLVPMAEARKVPVLGIVSGAEFIYQPVHRYVFNLRSSNDVRIGAMIDGIWPRLRTRRVAIIYQYDALGASGLRSTTLALEKHGASPTASVAFSRNSKNFREMIETAKAKNPEAVILSANSENVRLIVEQARSIGWRPIFLTPSTGSELYRADGVVVAEFLPDLDDMRFPTVKLYQDLIKRHPKFEGPGYQGLEGFVQAILIVEGLRRTGKALTREKFVDALETIHDFPVGLGPNIRINFSSSSHMGTDASFLVVVRHGKAVPFSDWKEVMP